jgi:trk system potassium uptake protein TrkA
MIKIKLPDGNMLDGMTIADLRRLLKCNILICAIERAGEIYIPSGDFRLQSGDLISYAGDRREGRLFLKKIGFPTKQVKNTMIVGGGRAAYYLASTLLHMGISVKIIESNRQRCDELSTLLPDAIIINGDGTNQELLKEEGLEEAESFVPLTGIDEENVMLTLHAKGVSKAKVITKVNRINFSNVINHLDLGSVLYPKYITAEAIIAYVRARRASSEESNIETLYHLFDQRVEAIEFHVTEESAVTNKTLMELSFKKNLLIAFISRRGSIIIPSGQDMIRVGDNVMIVTTHTGFNDIQDILN